VSLLGLVIASETWQSIFVTRLTSISSKSQPSKGGGFKVKGSEDTKGHHITVTFFALDPLNLLYKIKYHINSG